MDLWDYDVREFDLRYELIESFLKYLNFRRGSLRWVILFHDKGQRCDSNYNHDIYYHVIVWFHTHSDTGKKRYFSNLPLMQWIRRTYRSHGWMEYPNVLCFGNIGLRIDQLLSMRHIYMKHMSFPHFSVDDILSMHG